MNNDATSRNSPASFQERSVQSLLVVDDDPDIRETMGMVLEAAGYRVSLAADGEEALKIFENQPFDLVITDMLMPGSDGLELLSVVRKSARTCKVLVMSGGGMIGVDGYLNVAKKLGAHGVLEKPFTSETLLTSVAGLLKQGS